MICFTVGILSVLLLWWRVGVFLLLLRSNFVPLFLKLFHMVAAPQQQILESLAKRTFPAASALVIFLELTSEGHPRCKSTWTLAEVTLKSEGNIDQDLNTLWLLWISRVIPGCSVPCSKYENFNMFSFSFWGLGGWIMPHFPAFKPFIPVRAIFHSNTIWKRKDRLESKKNSLLNSSSTSLSCFLFFWMSGTIVDWCQEYFLSSCIKKHIFKYLAYGNSREWLVLLL